MIVQELHAIQHRHGFLPNNELRALAARTGTHLHRLQEVASFYPHFRLDPPAPVQLKICQDMSCALRGACNLLKQFQGAAEKYSGPAIEVQGVSCLGRCDRAPAASIAAIIEEPGGHNAQQSVAHEHVCYALDVDRHRLAKMVKYAAQAVASRDAAELPPTDTDLAWGPSQTESWKIDVYRGQADSEKYRAVRQWIERRGQKSSSLPWRVSEAVVQDVEKALRGSLADMDAESTRIICSLYNANLLGMGGAGGRAYKKWFEVYQALGDVKYVVCNGDESEPGTFKDREILLRSPHLVVEGVVLACLLLGAKQAYIYIRHEFEEQIQAVRTEIERAEKLGACGKFVFGSELSCSVEVFVSPGGYICGEQTALIEAMEDKRAEPRNRPPELQTNGLWNCPTLLNNVETLAWVPAIVLGDDGNWFASEGRQRAGRPKYLGRRFFSISGDVARPGAYEVPIGLTLGELIEDFAGGMAAGKPFKAVALSGPSGGFVPRLIPVEYLRERFVAKQVPVGETHFDVWNMELDIQASRDMGIMMGAGMVVFGDSADMVKIALACTEFYRNESCGKCVPCRLGSQKLVEILTDISDHKYSMDEIYGVASDAHDGSPGMRGLINELAETMTLTAICGLGTVASNPLTSLLNHFRADVAAYARKTS